MNELILQSSKAIVRNIFKSSEKNTIFNEHSVPQLSLFLLSISPSIYLSINLYYIKLFIYIHTYICIIIHTILTTHPNSTLRQRKDWLISFFLLWFLSDSQNNSKCCFIVLEDASNCGFLRIFVGIFIKQ